MPDSKNNFAFPLPKLPIRGMLISKNKGVPAWWPYAAMPGGAFFAFWTAGRRPKRRPDSREGEAYAGLYDKKGRFVRPAF